MIFNKLRLLTKRIIIAIGYGDRLIEYCQDCGIEQPVYWWADNEIWSAVTGEQAVIGDNMPGVFCPACFDRRAQAKGIFLRWEPRRDER